MDPIIEKINAYNLYATIENKPVILKRQKSTKVTITYLVYPCTEISIEYIKSFLTLPSQILDHMVQENYLTKESDIEQVLHCGNLEEFYPNNLVYKYPQRKIDIINRVEPIYRSYILSKEVQEQYMYVHNMCPTAEHSWKTVIKKVGSKYGLVLKIKTINNGNIIQKG